MRRGSLIFLFVFPLVWVAVVVALLQAGPLGIAIAALFVINSVVIFWRRPTRSVSWRQRPQRRSRYQDSLERDRLA
jgi:hypothetical protein